MYISGIKFANPTARNNKYQQNFSGHLYFKRDFLTTLREMKHINGGSRFNLGEINPIADNIPSVEAAELIKWLAQLTDKSGKYRFNGDGLTTIGRNIRTKEDAKLARELVEMTDKNGNPQYTSGQIEEKLKYARLR